MLKEVLPTKGDAVWTVWKAGVRLGDCMRLEPVTRVVRFISRRECPAYALAPFLAYTVVVERKRRGKNLYIGELEVVRVSGRWFIHQRAAA